MLYLKIKLFDLITKLLLYLGNQAIIILFHIDWQSFDIVCVAIITVGAAANGNCICILSTFLAAAVVAALPCAIY